MPLLFGRERDVDVLADLVDRVGERGGAVVIRGDAGIGKSALLAAANRRARLVLIAGSATSPHRPTGKTFKRTRWPATPPWPVQHNATHGTFLVG